MFKHFYSSNLVPAAPVQHGYRNFWVRDGFYIGLCNSKIRERLWGGMISLLERYKWKLEFHSKNTPIHWYEHMHVRYSEQGYEIPYEHWLHNQFDAHANWGEICIDQNRLDLVELWVDYLNTCDFHKSPCAGPWEDRNTTDAYSIAACLHFLQRAQPLIPSKSKQIDGMIKRGTKQLYSLLPYATPSKVICLSLLGVIWPYNMAGPYKDDIIDLVSSHLMREPFGFIRFRGDTYTGEHFTQREGNEYPWLLGDLFMGHIQQEIPVWIQRLKRAYEHFGCMPEAYDQSTMKANRNTPLLWAEAMWEHLQSGNLTDNISPLK